MTRGVWTASQVWTATGFNDAFKPPYCCLYQSANISIATSGTAQALTFDSEVVDNLSMHSVVTNTSRINVPADGSGMYLIGGAVRFATNATGYRQLEFRINGTTAHIARYPSTGGATQTYVSAAFMYPLSDYDYVELWVAQTSGGALNAEAVGTYGMQFYAIWMGVS